MRTRKHIASPLACAIVLLSLVTGLTGEGKRETAPAPDAKALAGCYSSSAPAMSLTLEESGQYTAEWHDCFGNVPNQRKAGEWTLCDGQITFNPSPSVILEGLKPEEHEGEWLLVPTGKIGRFLCEKLGVAGASFHKHMTQNDRAGGTR